MKVDNSVNMENVGSIGNITNKPKTVLKKNSKVIIVILIAVALAIIAIVWLSGDDKSKIVGTWATDDGKYIEFLVDGTIKTDMHYVEINPNTYEILSDGSLKWGEYDAGWIQYFYSYWDLDVSGKNMTLTSKDDPTEIIKLTKQK